MRAQTHFCSVRRVRTVWTALVIICGATHADDSQRKNHWDAAIEAFEMEDATNPPPQGAIVFIGSSSIRFWDTDAAFPDHQVINRGFGGSHISDCNEYVHRIVTPYNPRLVVLYAGDNDIADGKSPAQVFADFVEFTEIVRLALPQTNLLFISIKPSIARWNLVSEMREANTRIRNFAAFRNYIDYIDIDTPMIGGDGLPRSELFAPDGLHLSAVGYELWNSVIDPFLEEDHWNTTNVEVPLVANWSALLCYAALMLLVGYVCIQRIDPAVSD